MRIVVNKKDIEVSGSSLTVNELLQNLEMSSSGVAVAVGRIVISRNEWDTTTITEGADITIIRATQGG